MVLTLSLTNLPLPCREGGRGVRFLKVSLLRSDDFREVVDLLLAIENTDF